MGSSSMKYSQLVGYFSFFLHSVMILISLYSVLKLFNRFFFANRQSGSGLAHYLHEIFAC